MAYAGEREHRRFSPSQAERFRACHGSTNLLARVPKRPSSKWAIEGTNAHTVLEAALVNGVRDSREAHVEYSELFAEDLNTSENMFYFSIQVALDYIYGILDEYPGSTLFAERFVNPPVESAPGEAGGYCDTGIWVPALRRFYSIDYKHGAGVVVEAKNNKQLAIEELTYVLNNSSDYQLGLGPYKTKDK
jgi:hypothetical protein